MTLRLAGSWSNLKEFCVRVPTLHRKHLLVAPQDFWYFLNVFKFSGPRAMFAPFVVSYAQGGQMAPCALRPAGAEAVFPISPSA